MKIVFNSLNTQSPAYVFYKSGLERMEDVKFGVRDSYKDFDVALFMGFKEDLKLIKEAKSQNPKLIVGIVDPRGDHIGDHLHEFDFILLDSLEMKDYFSKFGKPMFKYYEYLDVKERAPKAGEKEKIIIGYHGNKVHLMGMNPHIKNALSKLGSEYSNIEFWAYYNVKNLGEWDIGLPENMKVKHIQFDESTYEDTISQMDIGITPALIPFSSEGCVRRSSFGFRRILNHSSSDYLMRFKMLTNIGRLIVFAKLGVPVVSDMYPSAMEIIKDGKNGFLACSSAGWYSSLKQLIDDSKLRNRMASDLQRDLLEVVDYDHQNKEFLSFLNNTDFSKTSSVLLFEGSHSSFNPIFLSLYAIKKKLLHIFSRIFGA